MSFDLSEFKREHLAKVEKQADVEVAEAMTAIDGWETALKMIQELTRLRVRYQSLLLLRVAVYEGTRARLDIVAAESAEQRKLIRTLAQMYRELVASRTTPDAPDLDDGIGDHRGLLAKIESEAE